MGLFDFLKKKKNVSDMAKKIVIENHDVSIIRKGQEDFISLTDMANSQME